jgi:hypothetical protein
MASFNAVQPSRVASSAGGQSLNSESSAAPVLACGKVADVP